MHPTNADLPTFDLKEAYDNLMQLPQTFENQNFINSIPQWSRPGDYFNQFSLYPSVQTGKTTTETQMKIDQ
jgi:hypothetical protein